MPPFDQYAADSSAGTSGNPVAITPNDDTDLTTCPKFLFVGTGGNVTVIPQVGSTAVVFKNVPAGGYIFARVSRVKLTGTTAADIVGLF